MDLISKAEDEPLFRPWRIVTLHFMSAPTKEIRRGHVSAVDRQQFEPRHGMSAEIQSP